jgi:phosphoribosyl 1,2-cyclic phosphodiesterase
MEFIAHASGSTGNLYQVISGDKSLIIDPGIPIAKIKRALNFKLSSVSGALISHSHGDHSKAVHSLAKYGVNCWLTEPTAKALNFESPHRCHIIKPMQQFNIEPFSFVPFPTQHDCAGAVGFLISDGESKLLFATDTFYIHNRFTGVNIITIECNYSKETLDSWLHPERKKRLYKSHFSLENVIKFLRANDLTQVYEIWLLHLSKENADPAFFKSEVERATGIQVHIAGE